MSDFKRTTYGLSNQHLFYDVDLIVFLEGGNTSYSKEQAYSDHYHSETEDIIFWRRIFQHFKSDSKIKFKSIGSKTTIKEIALDVVEGELQTVYVAMDSEFDEIMNRKINHPNIFYTRGYSWENDCWNENVIKSVIEELSAIEILDDEIEKNFNDFIKKMKYAVIADAYLFEKASSFFPRKSGYLFCIDCSSMETLPTIKEQVIALRMEENVINKDMLEVFDLKHNINTHKYIFGHLLADYCCQLILRFLRVKHNIAGPRKDILYRIGLNKFFLTSFNDNEIFEYYKGQVCRNQY